MSRRRQLSDEERALWAGFARSITPLRRPRDGPDLPTADEPAISSAPAPETTHRAVPPTRPTKAPPLAPMERRLKQRVARGREPIDARIDLHGMTQKRAHVALLRFLARAQADGARIALVVTGKGAGRSATDAPDERGVLKRQVPNWLSLPEFRAFVIGFEQAHVGHGGEGALYVRLRRER